MQTLAEWGVDYLKLDGCYAKPTVMDKGYPNFTKALNKTKRPIVFSCSWPAYQVYAKMEVRTVSSPKDFLAPTINYPALLLHLKTLS